MKQYIITLLAILTIVSCKKDSNDDGDDPRMAGSAMTTIYATGKVSEQSAAEAKKTIFGKWDVGASSSKSYKTSKKNSDCVFNYIEFTDDTYLISLGLVVDGETESGSIFGDYELIESGGSVTEVRLYYSVSGSNIQIATLTDIEVTETSGSLDATFTINFEIDLGEINITCNDLGGDYSADKDEAMDETTSADEDSNHYKLVRNWRATSYNDSDGGTLSSWLEDYCRYDYYNPETGEWEDTIDEDCTIPSGIQVNISTFGTYVFITLDAAGSPLTVDVGTWDWIDAAQTQFEVDGEQIFTITSLTTTNWAINATDEVGGFSFTQSYEWEVIP